MAETMICAVGDVVSLSAGVPHEFRNSRAVITRTESSHCTVCVLDETGRFGVGECWPSFADVKLVSTTLRLGNRVVADGCSGPQTRWLNGHAGTIVSHRREGHPCFVHSKRHLNRPPQFNVCICLEQPPSPGERLVLIEPRFLSEYDQFTEEATDRLGAVVRRVSVSSLAFSPCSLTVSPECLASVADFDTPRCYSELGAATPSVSPGLDGSSAPAPQAPSTAQELSARDIAATTCAAAAAAAAAGTRASNASPCSHRIVATTAAASLGVASAAPSFESSRGSSCGVDALLLALIWTVDVVNNLVCGPGFVGALCYNVACCFPVYSLHINSAAVALMSPNVVHCFREPRWNSMPDIHTQQRAELCRAAFGGCCGLYEAYCLLTFFCAAMGYSFGCCPGISYWLGAGIGYGLLPVARDGVQDVFAADGEFGWGKHLVGVQTFAAKFANREGVTTFAGLCIGSSVALWAIAFGVVFH